jgi:hypothetical protein
MDERERQIRIKLRDDFPHYASRCLKIRTKSGQVEPLILNEAQLLLHARLQQQIETLGRVRALVLKGRQQGVSTYTEGRFYWRVTHRKGTKAYILTHEEQATTNLFKMCKRYHQHCPNLVKPHTAASNAKELVFDKLDSGYGLGTAGGRGAGRSDTIQLFHASEMAYWPNAESHVAGALQAVPDEPGTEVIIESTSAGPQGKFYDMWQAAERGDGDYIAVFIPWFIQAEYRKPLPDNFSPTPDEVALAEKYGLDNEQLAWRRSKIVELGGIGHFRREYPCTAQEAFAADAEGALWRREQIEALRVAEYPELVRIVVAVDPAVTSNPDSCETGIVVVGMGEDGHGYVLEDLSGRYSPAGWATKAILAYHTWEADKIVGEVNNGGDLVEVNLRTVDNTIPYKSVHASRGKKARAEPIAAFYERGEAHHVGIHDSLEDQMVNWDPAKSTISPDRIDALVWGLWELMAEKQQETHVW